MSTPQPLSEALTEQILVNRDTGSLSATDLMRENILRNSETPDGPTMIQVLGDSQHQINRLRQENQKLKGENAALEADNRLLRSQLRSAGRRYAPREPADAPKSIAAKTGVLYIAFFNLRWDKLTLFGPEPPSHFDPQPFARTTSGDLEGDHTNVSRYWLYKLSPMEYHSSLADRDSEFAKKVFKAGADHRASCLGRLREVAGALLGNEISSRMDASILIKASLNFAERKNDPTLQALLGYKPPTSEHSTASYSLLPPILFLNLDTKKPSGFLRHPVCFRAGRVLAYGSSSIASAEAINAQSNSVYSHSEHKVRATRPFMAFIGTLIIHLLSPDTEFPSKGKGVKSGIHYYEVYDAILKALDMDSKLTEKLLNTWDAEIFPPKTRDSNYDSDSGWDSEGDEHPELLAFAQGIQELNEDELTLQFGGTISSASAVQASTNPPTRPASPVLEHSLASLALVEQPPMPIPATSAILQSANASRQGTERNTEVFSLRSTSVSLSGQRRRQFRQPTPAEPTGGIIGDMVDDDADIDPTTQLVISDTPPTMQQPTTQDAVGPAVAPSDAVTPAAQPVEARRTRRTAIIVSEEVTADTVVDKNNRGGTTTKPRPKRGAGAKR
ncbi:hypothetical protein BKA70DRAFT_1446661 [Coprinopsis sp. MPI-PUGE-AT-0042]|nr:hypothetical protein BKA70DRAFT_1446661 [Coprinopsis sp. MPI-PUGE-AT-0042]